MDLLGSAFGEANVSELTERQKQCLNGAFQRKTAKQIGRDLGITHHAVEQHLKAARRKLNAADTNDAVRIFAASLHTDEHYYRSPELADLIVPQHLSDQPERVVNQLRDVATERVGSTPTLSARQTLVAIGVCALGIVAIVALIVAIAQGLAQLAP